MAILLPNGKQVFTGAGGLPLVGGKVYTYAAGTSTPQPTYSDASGLVANTNPVVLDARGEATIFWNGNYKVVLRDFLDNIIWTVDNVSTIDPLAAVVAALQASLAGAGGAGLIGFQQTGSDLVRTLLAKGREAPVTPDDFSGTDQQKVQAALNQRGNILLTREYAITATLTIYGNTQLRGVPGARLKWAGPATDTILQDSSVGTPTDINLNILMENFEIDGGYAPTATVGQFAINFYRTGNVIMRDLLVHGIGGSGIRWGLSMADTVNILVENCRVYDCKFGDAIQGVGRKIVVRNCVVGKIGSTTSNFGDTAIALLYDFSATTNPGGTYTTDWEFTGNTIIGNYNLAGVYVGNGQPIQTGIAFGPFNNGVNTNGRVLNNTMFGCYLNLWGIVCDNVLISGNDFGSHAATATGNVRIDGITNCRIRGNFITMRLAGTGSDYAGILLNAQRNVYGASVFDADVRLIDVSDNFITSIQGGVTGIRATFEQTNSGPAYTSKMIGARIDNNTFSGIATGVALAPISGVAASTCVDVAIRSNKLDAVAAAIVNAGGGSGQFTNVRVLDNITPSNVIPVGGTGLADVIVRHKVANKVSAPTGTPTTIFTVPGVSFYRITLYVWVKAGAASFSSLVTVVSNNGTAELRNIANGANLTISLAGLSVQASQTTGGTNDIYMTAVYE